MSISLTDSHSIFVRHNFIAQYPRVNSCVLFLYCENFLLDIFLTIIDPPIFPIKLANVNIFLVHYENHKCDGLLFLLSKIF
jgi:hypothetical protein